MYVMLMLHIDQNRSGYHVENSSGYGVENLPVTYVPLSRAWFDVVQEFKIAVAFVEVKVV